MNPQGTSVDDDSRQLKRFEGVISSRKICEGNGGVVICEMALAHTQMMWKHHSGKLLVASLSIRQAS